MFYLWQDDPGTALHMSDEEREGALARNNALSGYTTDAIGLFNKHSRVRWLRGAMLLISENFGYAAATSMTP